jgi:GT2 family glycosyltransferase
MSSTPSVAFVLATMNRRDVVLSTLARLHEPERTRDNREIVVCVNPSTDGTAEAVRDALPDVQVVALDRNFGSCAKSIGVSMTRSEYVVFLDDDSYPRPGCIAGMLDRFAADSRLGAAAFMVHLPDGRRECSAFPGVFVGCGVGFRRAALEAVGGLDGSFFMQAEEYDLSFRLVAGGWTIKTFTDLGVDHLKTPQARLSGRTVYYDTRNNLIVVARYLPPPFHKVYARDWLQRYHWIAAANGQRRDYLRGMIAGLRRFKRERSSYGRWRLSPAAFETLFHHAHIAVRMRQLADGGARRVVLADLGKNLYAFVQAAQAGGLTIQCIADDRFARPGRRYRGYPVLSVEAALTSRPDAVVISNTSPVHTEATGERLRALTDVPVHCWFAYDTEG